MYLKADCKELRDELLSEVKEYSSKTPIRKLVIIRIGDDYASKVYTKNKVKTCAEAGIEAEIVEFPERIAQHEIILRIQDLNRNPKVGGILVQLPLPEMMNERKVLNAISPEKDVDCITDVRTGKFYTSKSPYCLAPCTASGIVYLVNYFQEKYFDLPRGGRAVILGRSDIVGKPTSELLTKMDFTTCLCHSKTQDLRLYLPFADIIVCAVGHEKFLDWAPSDALVIDVGINRNEEGKLCGDVCEELAQNCFVTPVPGGIGTLTTAMVCMNMMKLDMERRK